MEFGFLCLQRPCLHLFPAAETPTCLKPKLMMIEKVIDLVFRVPVCNVKNWVETVPEFMKTIFAIYPALLWRNSIVRKTGSMIFFKSIYEIMKASSITSKNIIKTSAMPFKNLRWCSIFDVWLGFEYASDEDLSRRIETNRLICNGKNRTGICWLY